MSSFVTCTYVVEAMSLACAINKTSDNLNADGDDLHVYNNIFNYFL